MAMSMPMEEQLLMAQQAGPSKRTLSPIVTGASVLAITYADGVMMVADTLGSYGSLARFRNIQRIRQINQYTAVGASGEYSDFQYITDLMNEVTTRDFIEDDGTVLSAKAIHSYLSRVLYNRRSKSNPLWNQLVIAGFDPATKKPYLGTVDLYGSTFVDDMMATGYGAHLAMPIMRRRWRPNMTEQEARKLLEDCMAVLSVRDCLAINKVQLCKIGAGVKVDGKPDEHFTLTQPYAVQQHWEHKMFVSRAQ